MLRFIPTFLLVMLFLGVVYYGFKALPAKEKLIVLKWSARLVVLATVTGAGFALIVNLF